MLELHLSLIEDELYHHTGNQSKSNRSHEYEVIRIGCLFDVNEFLVDWERLIDHIVCKVRVTSCHSEDGLIHELGEHSCGIRGSRVEVANDAVKLTLLVCLVDLVRAIAVRKQGQLIAILIDGIIEFRVVHALVN